MTQTVLPCRYRNALSIHYGLIPVAECMETASLNPQLIEQRMEFAFPLALQFH